MVSVRQRRAMATPLAEMMESARLSRRQFVQGGLVCAGAIGVASAAVASPATRASAGSASGLRFTEITKRLSPMHHIAPGYRVEPLLRWGDPLEDAPGFDPQRLTPEEQRRRFGYNNDYVAFLPLTRGGSESRRGLLCVNHEYVNPPMMFPGISRLNHRAMASDQQLATEMEAVGCSVVEVYQDNDGRWHYKSGSARNRRITATTPMRFAGPATGHDDLKTSADPAGTTPIGTFGNCAGGVTPWGTVLTAEENVDDYFTGEQVATGYQERYDAYGITGPTYYDWDRIDNRFDFSKEPNEPNRFGWIVEYDPYEPEARPIKRTALGRFKHECATTVLNHDGRVVVFSGDDEVFEYVYRFVSDGVYDPDIHEHNQELLDHGVLSVARFDEGGQVEWLPLIYGERGLTPENGFHSQGDVLIYARQAADILGATPMDRPEDVEVNPVIGNLYISLTKNHDREKRNAANARAANPYGHILELSPPSEAGGRDYAATRWSWSEFLRGGNPANSDHDAMYLTSVSEAGWLANPDNVAFDGQGRIWICTDGQESSIGTGEGLYAAECSGPAKGATRLFFTTPQGAEVTGPAFTPDSRSLFLSIQHPGEGSSFEHPATRWPDFRVGMPPRPAVVAIRHKKGQPIGS